MKTLQLTDTFAEKFVEKKALAANYEKVLSSFETVKNGTGAGSDFLGWYDLPVNYDKEEFARIKLAAEKIKKTCDVLVVIGIGGSYLGARAAVEFCKSPLYNALKKDTPDVYFAGNNISTTQMTELLSILEGRDVCINVISKSGTTTEPAIAFRVLKDLLYKKYGKDGARERIFVTTDREKGTLKHFADESGFETFVVPDDVGGRFSVLTAVGLLPIAVAGIDIDEMMKGAADAKANYTSDRTEGNDAFRYAAYRNTLLAMGKNVEVMVGYEPYMLLLNEWWKQLFGESEGKDGKGILPDSVVFSTDLHSLGQYLQSGQRMLFETVVTVKNPGAPFTVPFDDANLDGLNFIAGKTLTEVNEAAMTATLVAHSDGDVPNLHIELADRSAYTFGYAVFFYELACAVSGYTLGVNPFNQPGVEEYKKNMFALLGKPGYEEKGVALRARLDDMTK